MSTGYARGRRGEHLHAGRTSQIGVGSVIGCCWAVHQLERAKMGVSRQPRTTCHTSGEARREALREAHQRRGPQRGHQRGHQRGPHLGNHVAVVHAISGHQWPSVAISGDHLNDRMAVVQDLLQSTAIKCNHLNDRMAVVQDLLVGNLLARTDDRAVLKLTPVGVHAIARPIRVHEDVRDAHGEGLVVVAAVEGRDGAVRALRGHDGGLGDAIEEAIKGAIKEAIKEAIKGAIKEAISHLGDAIKEADDAGTPTRHAELPMGWVDARGSAHRDA